MKKGKFIVLEGINSCGKTTHQELLLSKFIDEYPDMEFALRAEPTYHLPIGKALREIYLKKERIMNERSFAMLYALDRYDQISNPIDGTIARINNGITVIQSRNYLSSLAIETDGITIDEVYDLNRDSINLLHPDIIVYIDVDINDVIKYHDNKNDNDIFENTEKLIKIKEGYEKAIEYLRKNTNENIVTIDGKGSVEEVNERIWNVVKHLF